MLRARIAMLLFDAGLVEGSTPPETEQQLCANALQGLDALRRCANNALLTPAVQPRGGGGGAVRTAAAAPGDKRLLSLGSSEMQALLASGNSLGSFGVGAAALSGGALSTGAMRLSGGGLSFGSALGSRENAGEPLLALGERGGGGGGGGDGARYGCAAGLDAAGLDHLHAVGLDAHSSGVGEDGSATTQPEEPRMHACRNCQRAKTACMDVRPCPRCVRLGIPCDSDAKTVKRACVLCKRAKVKCDLDEQVSLPASRKD
jgi:hypothetical protein